MPELPDPTSRFREDLAGLARVRASGIASVEDAIRDLTEAIRLLDRVYSQVPAAAVPVKSVPTRKASGITGNYAFSRAAAKYRGREFGLRELGPMLEAEGWSTNAGDPTEITRVIIRQALNDGGGLVERVSHGRYRFAGEVEPPGLEATG